MWHTLVREKRKSILETKRARGKKKSWKRNERQRRTKGRGDVEKREGEKERKEYEDKERVRQEEEIKRKEEELKRKEEEIKKKEAKELLSRTVKIQHPCIDL